jgi:hypothetical protein
MKCSKCYRELKRGERELALKNHSTLCAECEFHEINGTDTIAKYNEWLLKKD